MSNGKLKCLSVVYNDFMLSILATRQNELEKGLTYQIPLEAGIVKNGMIEDEDAFFYLLKDLLKKLKIKKHTVRIVAPSFNILMKKIALPTDLDTPEMTKEYIEGELNNSIQLPFEEPVYDIYDENPTDGEALLFATEYEDVDKVVRIFEDLGQFPDVVDIKSLVDLRILSEILPDFNDQTTLVLDWSMDELRMAIVEQGDLQLLRTVRIATSSEDWTLDNEEEGIVHFSLTANKGEYEQEISQALMEIDKAVNFYQFSLNKGSKEIQNVINIGDHPMLGDITEMMKAEVPLPVMELTNDGIDSKFPTYHVKHMTLLGLTTKGVSYE